jgi:AcrR family transcriptional regulator
MAMIAEETGTSAGKPRQHHPVGRARRPDPRAVATKERIFDATTRVMLRAGVQGMSIQDIAVDAGVSRGTLYRYFASKNALLDAYTEFMRGDFDATLKAAIVSHDEPTARLDAFLDFFDAYLSSERARSFLEAEPEFALGYFRRSFGDGVAKVRDALGPVFHHWSQEVGHPLDQQMLAEMIMRLLISHVLVPEPRGSMGLARKLMCTLRQMAGGQAPAPSRRSAASVTA